MWLQRFTNYILRHRWQTLVLVLAGTFVPVIGIIGIIIAALVTLRKSIAEGALLTIAATLPYFLTFFLPAKESGGGVPLAIGMAVGVAVCSNLLTWIFAVMLRRQNSWSAIIQIAALLGVLVVSVIHLAYPNVSDWWGTQLQSYYNHAAAMTDMLKNQASTGLSTAASTTNESQFETISATKQYASGLMIAAILFNALLQLIMARWWQTVVFHRGFLQKELHGIRLSQLAGTLFASSLVLSYLGNSVVLDIMPILYALFCAAGLSLIHYFFGQSRSPTTWFWLLVFYITLILTMLTSVLIISILALADIWFDLRKRLKKG